MRCFLQLAAFGLILMACASDAEAQNPAVPGMRAAARSPSDGRPGSQKRDVSLRELISISLHSSEIVKNLSGGVGIESATGFDPWIAETEITQQQSRFDPSVSAGLIGNQINLPPDSLFGPGLAEPTTRDEADFTARLSKRWQAGTSTTFGFEPPLGYLYLPDGADDSFNPLYASDLVLRLRQPLLRGRGKDYNVAAIRIAKIRSNQSRWDVKEAVVTQIRSIEQAYWSLQAAYSSRQVVDQVLPLAEESLRLEQLRFQVERTIYADVARARVALERLRQERIDLDLEVRRREYQLRFLVGLPIADGAALVPADRADRKPPQLEVNSVIAVAMRNRPDLHRRRLDLQTRQVRLMRAKNELMPQLEFQAEARASGRGRQFDHAFRQMTNYKYRNWTAGLEFEVPLGNRRAKAAATAAELELTRQTALLRAYEQQIGTELATLVAKLEADWASLQSAMKRVEDTREWLRLSRIRYSQPPPTMGQNGLLVALNDYQQAMQANIDAVQTAAERLAEFNITQARIAEQQGVSLERWRIELVDSSRLPLPLSIPAQSGFDWPGPMDSAPVSRGGSFLPVIPGAGEASDPNSYWGPPQMRWPERLEQPVPQRIPMQPVPNSTQSRGQVIERMGFRGAGHSAAAHDRVIPASGSVPLHSSRLPLQSTRSGRGGRR